MERRPWRELPGTHRTAIILVGAVELVLTTLALRDLKRRPAELVRGPKPLWALVSTIQPIGPPPYFLLGRRS